ncbi:MAG TPA: acetyltransferase [Methylomusa anaerophila]|uniref:Putative acetyltransferase EpsM n=1 Tax=Methylomusa anaerophila TaxID=1930071 RepID=A0A348AI26_9FIRM|nr:acetyltransferase [Methylomusa anaerophila]BBB90724.1 putative acetyltransferase EpsM [Methylomusa anaerophila]HML88673.1 acetyltransferase [Methylomusa anaerophila]
MPELKNNVILVGAGGHAKVIIDILRSRQQYTIVTCVDRPEKAGGMVGGVPVVSDASSVDRLFATVGPMLDSGITKAFVAIGDNRRRMVIVDKMREWGFTLVNAISPFAYVSETVKLSDGIAIMPGAVVNADATIMADAIINTNASVDHDCIIMNCSHVAPGCSIAGNVTIGQGTFVGIGAKVIPNLCIGDWSVIGAGATVVSNLPAHVVAFGVPAKVQKFLAKI